MRIREATPEDARAIAGVRVDTWRAAYDGLAPVALLTALDADGEAPGHRDRLTGPRPVGRRELVAEADGRIVGWAAVGPSTDDASVGELYALYVLPSHWGTGTGHALLGEGETGLRTSGFERAVLWVLDGNARAAAFYESHGWLLDGGTKSDDSFGDWIARELRRVKALR